MKIRMPFPFRKTKERAEKSIEKAEETLGKADLALENINDIAVDVKEAMSGVKTLIMLSTVGVFLGITADIVSMIVSGRTVKIIKK